MELRIGINDRRKQLAGICRDYLRDFQNGVQYQFPHPVRNGQLESTSSGFTEEFSDGLVCLKPLHRAKYDILHHGQREAGNLRREVYALTSAEVEQLLAVVISHLSSPTGSVRPVCIEEAERKVCGKQPVPLPFSSSFREEQADGSTCKLHVYGAVGASECPAVLGKSLFLELCNNLISSQVALLGVVLGLAKFNHANQVALDVATGYQVNKVCTGKPTINQQIVETEATLDGILHHLDGFVNLRHRVLLDAFLDNLSAIILAIPGFALHVRQSLLLVRLAALLAMKREVEEQLAHAVAQKQSQALVAEDALMLDMGEHLADELTLTPALWSVSVIDNQAYRLVVQSLCTAADLSEQLEVHCIQQFAPFVITIIHKTIEHVFLTTEQAA